MRESGSLEKRCTAPRRTRSLGFQGLRSQPEGMRKTGSLEKKCTAPRRTRSLGFQGCGPSRKEQGKLVPSKKKQCIPASPTSWLPWRSSRREGMRKSGSVEKEYGDSPAAQTSWFPGRGSEPRGMSKSGSSKKMCRHHSSSLNWKVSRRARRAVGFARDRKVEGPAE